MCAGNPVTGAGDACAPVLFMASARPFISVAPMSASIVSVISVYSVNESCVGGAEPPGVKEVAPALRLFAAMVQGVFNSNVMSKGDFGCTG